MTGILIKCGLRESKEDPCLFYAKDEDKFIYCAVHVDDVITVSSDDGFERLYMDRVKRYIDLKDLGEAKEVLEMQLRQDEGKIFVHRRKYIQKMLILYGMEECNTVTTPIDPNVNMDKCDGSESTDIKEYQELLGRLMYLSVSTRPDLSFALSNLSRFNNEPKVMQMALKRILRYLRGTINYRLEYGKKGSDMLIECEADASWDRTKDAKSFTGLLLYRNGYLIHWRSKKQSMVALSSTENELEAMLEGTKEMMWTRSLLKEIGLAEEIFMELRCDNLNAVKLTNGGNFKTKSKLLNRKCQYIREAVKQEDIHVRHVPNEEMTADSLTKPLSVPMLMKNVKRFMNVMGR